jgi:SNF2 family DNA or RNA helicase
MTKIQLLLYYHILLSTPCTTTKLLSTNNIIMKLRQICCHPYTILENMKCISDELYYQDLITICGKFVILEKLLSHLLQGSKHKVFHHYTSDQLCMYLYACMYAIIVIVVICRF